MRKGHFTEAQIIGMVKEQEAGRATPVTPPARFESPPRPWTLPRPGKCCMNLAVGNAGRCASPFDLFVETFEEKYPRATEGLIRDRDELLTFYECPAQHWQSIRTSNPIESAFATIRHRTKRTQGCLSRGGMLHMMFKFGQCAEKADVNCAVSPISPTSSKAFRKLECCVFNLIHRHKAAPV